MTLTAGAEEKAAVRAQIVRFRDGQPISEADWLSAEEPLEIRVRGRSVAVTMRTPGHDAELSCGFLLTEALLKRRSDVIEVAPCRNSEAGSAGNILNVFVSPEVKIDFDRLSRHTFASSSCGLCGKASIESVHQHLHPVTTKCKITSEVLLQLPETLRAAQASFARTGGLHAAGIFNLNGELLALREDVGRHNAVDKVIGWAFLNNLLPLHKHILFVSGRTSFEIVQKALAAGLAIVAAVSAPSSLAVEFARESGQSLVGFVRGNSFNIYSGAERIRFAKKAGRSPKLR